MAPKDDMADFVVNNLFLEYELSTIFSCYFLLKILNIDKIGRVGCLILDSNQSRKRTTMNSEPFPCLGKARLSMRL